MNNLGNNHEMREIDRLNNIIFNQKNEIDKFSSVHDQVYQQNNYIHQISNENKRLKDENFHLSSFSDHIGDQLNIIKMNNNQYQTDNIKLNDTIKFMNSEKISLNSLLKSKEIENNELHKSIKLEIEKNKILSDDISTKQKKILQLNSLLKSTETKYNELQKFMNLEIEKNKNLSDDISTKKKCLEKLNNEHRKIKHDYMFTNSQNTKLINEISLLKSKNECLEKKYEEISKKCDKFENGVNPSLKRKLSENSINKLENNEDSNLENNEDSNKRLKTGKSNNMLYQIQMINGKKIKNNCLALSNLYDKNKHIILNLTFILLITNNLNLRCRVN